MKKFSRLIAFTLCFVIAMSSFAFAATPAAIKTKDETAKTKTVEIVSPADNSVVKSDSLLVSVKLNKAATIKVTVYEQKIENRKVITSYVSGAAVTREAISYSSVDTSKLEEKDLVSKAAIVSESSITTGAAVTKAAVSTSAAVSTKAAVNPYVDRLYVSPVYYTSKDEIGFYTKEINDVKPGMYKVVVEVVEEKTEKDKDGKEKKSEKVVETTESLIAVKEKPVEKQVTTKEKSGALTIISNLLKSLFK